MIVFIKITNASRINLFLSLIWFFLKEYVIVVWYLISIF